MIEYTGIYLTSNSVSDAVHSMRLLYKLLGRHRDIDIFRTPLNI